MYATIYTTIIDIIYTENHIIHRQISVGKKYAQGRMEVRVYRVVLQIWYRTSGNYGHAYTASTVCNAPLLYCIVYTLYSLL